MTFTQEAAFRRLTAMIPCALDHLRFDSLHLETDLRLQDRYHELVKSHLAHAHSLAAGVRPPASLEHSFAAVQGAWRFYANPRLCLEKLAQPLLQCARED